MKACAAEGVAGKGVGADAGNRRQKAEESVFAQPSKNSKTIPAADQKRIATDLMAVIQAQVLPTYHGSPSLCVHSMRMGKDPGVWAMPNAMRIMLIAYGR